MSREKQRIYDRRYHRSLKGRLRERGAPADDPGIIRDWINVAMLAKCHWCDADAEHIDHARPLAKGAGHVADNLVPACAKHNW